MPDALRPLAGIAILLAPATLLAQAGLGDSSVYVVAPGSRLEVRTGSAGLLGFVGHDHLIRARAFTGRIVYRSDTLSASRVEFVVRADSLEVLTPPDTEEIRKVTAVMRTEVLDVAHHSEIRFVSRRVRSRPQGFEIDGDFTIRGTTRPVEVDVRTRVMWDTLIASGAFALKQTDFGIHPPRAGPAGVVKVADRIRLQFDVVAIRAGGGT
jgi:polyisoprenoid-binding protein YceI